MKTIVLVTLALAALAVAAPADDAAAQVLRSDFKQEPEGSYSFNFETENGINRQENGELKEALDEENKPHTVVVVRGAYSYPDENGKPLSITYFADETGYHAEGESIPVASK